MKRLVAIAACGLALAGCSSAPSWMQFDLPRGTPAATTVQFESEPAGAEARTSAGQACRTPCALSVPASEFTVTFSQAGFQSQTIPVRIAANTEAADPTTGEMPAPRIVPNPVYVELQPAPTPPAARRRSPPPQKPRPAAAPRPAASAPPPMAPAPAPSAAWPPPPSR